MASLAVVPKSYDAKQPNLRVVQASAAREQREKAQEAKENEPNSVLMPWVQKLSYKEQRILMSAFRGADQPDDKGNMKQVIRMIRQVCQVDDRDDSDGAKHYLSKKSIDDLYDELDIKALRNELEHRSVHLFTHLVEALCICAREKGGPFKEIYDFLLDKVCAPLWGVESADAL